MADTKRIIHQTIDIRLTSDQIGTSNNVFANLLPLSAISEDCSDWGTWTIDQVSAAAAEDVMPAKYSGSAEVEFFGFVIYNSEPVATRFVNVNNDAVGAVPMGKYISGRAGTSFTIQTGAVNSVSAYGVWYLPKD